MIINNKQKSFTLIELLVVIVIIGILAGVIMISTSSSIDKANFAKAQAFSSTVQNELLSNLVSEWSFDEPEEGNITKDTWGNNHGTVMGALQVDDCVFGKCYSFDGVNDYIQLSHINFPLEASERTISAWVFMRTIPGTIAHIFHYGNNIKNQSWGLAIRKNTSGFGAHEWTVSDTDFAGKVPIGIWNFLTITLQPNGVKTHYMNGINTGTLIRIPNTVFGEYTAKIGTRISPAEYWDGLIDDVRIYNAALSSSQIKQNYIAGLNSMLANGNISKKEYNKRINTLAYEQE